MPLSERILKSDEPSHHVGLLKMYVSIEDEYKNECLIHVEDSEKFRFYCHRFKSALCYVADEVIVAKISVMEQGHKKDVKWRKERTDELFALLSDLNESVQDYLSEHA